MKRWTNGLPGAAKRLDAMMAIRGLSGSQPGCARIPMMARSNIAPLKRPDTLMQLSRSPARHSTLHRAAGPYIYGTTREQVFIDALAVPYDTAAFGGRFLKRWPAGSPA